jgi:hypothetical protein
MPPEIGEGEGCLTNIHLFQVGRYSDSEFNKYICMYVYVPIALTFMGI